MERHAVNPLDEVDHLKAVIRRLENTNGDLRGEVTVLKAQISAARDVLGSGAIKSKALRESQHAQDFDPKPASTSKATDTSSARQQSAPKEPVTGPRIPPTEAERFPSSTAGQRPELPSTCPEAWTTPNVGHPRPVLENVDSIRQRLRRERAAGTRPPLSEESQAKIASFDLRRLQMGGKSLPPKKEPIERAPFVVEYLDVKDAEHQDEKAGYSMEDLYDVSDDEAPTPQKAASAEGKRSHASNTDDEPTRKRARATVISPEARSIDFRQLQTPKRDHNCIIQVDDSEPYGSLNRLIFAHGVTVVLDSGSLANSYIGLRFNYMGSDGDEVAKMDWEIGAKVGGQWVVEEFNYVLVKDVPQDIAINHEYVLRLCPEAALPRLMCMTLVLTGQGQGYKRNDIGYAPDSLIACLETIINPRETFTLRIWFLVPVQCPDIDEKCLSVIRYLLGHRKELSSGVSDARGVNLTNLVESELLEEEEDIEDRKENEEEYPSFSDIKEDDEGLEVQVKEEEFIPTSQSQWKKDEWVSSMFAPFPTRSKRSRHSW